VSFATANSDVSIACFEVSLNNLNNTEDSFLSLKNTDVSIGGGQNDIDSIDNLRVVCWNVHGLAAKLQIATDFFQYLNLFDIFCLTETWIKSDFDILCFESKLTNFNLSWDFAKQTAIHGRAMGGILIGLKKSLKNHWKIDDFEGINFLRNISTGFLILPVYFPPFSWEVAFVKYWEFLNRFEFNNILFMGDVNARFGDLDCINFNLFPNIARRNAKDLIVNQRGSKIMEICYDFDLVLLNGRGFSDCQGDFTFINKNGQSTIDVALISRDIFDLIEDFKIDTRADSDHLPMIIWLKGMNNNIVQLQSVMPLISRLNWDLQNAEDYNSNFDMNLINGENDYSSVNEHVNYILKIINEVAIKKLAVKFYEKPWFDSECLKARKKLYKSLKHFKHNSNADNHDEVCINRKSFFHICKLKKIAYRDALIDDFGQISETADFWGAVKKLKKSDFCYAEAITADEWLNYFNNLLNPVMNFHYFSAAFNFIRNTDLDRDFGFVELKNAVQRLKNNKAPGLDGIPGEFFKYLTDSNLQHLLGIFNHIFNGAQLPDNFIHAIVFPLFKKGDLAIISNFRGISFLSSFYKIYTQLLLVRLQYFVFQSNLLHENQAGFRTGYSTYDHIFTISAIIEDQLAKPKGKVFAFFIDFSAAFDTVNRNSLIYKLHSYGFSTKSVEAIKAIYSDTRARVWTKKGYTDEFSTSCGVRQGCLLSPLLFTIYINDLVDAIDVGGFCYNGVWIRLLLYADDIVFLASSPCVMQEMIDRLENYCDIWDLKVNLNKSKIMVFRKGGRLSKKWNWHFNGSNIEIVNTYKYLGVNLVNSGSFGRHLKLQLAVAKSGLNSVYKSIFGLQSKNINSYFKLFDAVSRSVLCYAAQIWGYLIYDDVEKLLRFFIKKVFRLPYNTPNYMLLLETGRDSLFIYTLKLNWAFLSHTLQLSEARFSKIMFSIGVVHQHKWFKMIKDNAMVYGNWNKFDDFFDFPVVDAALADLYNYVISEQRRNLMDKVMLGQYHPLYKEIKLQWGMGEFLGLGLSLQEMRFILMARMEMLPLNWKPWFIDNDFSCTLCNLNEDENIIHFILKCPMLKEFRMRAFGRVTPSGIVDVLNGKHGWKKLAVFVNLALQYRRLIMEEFD